MNTHCVEPHDALAITDADGDRVSFRRGVNAGEPVVHVVARVRGGEGAAVELVPGAVDALIAWLKQARGTWLR